MDRELDVVSSGHLSSNDHVSVCFSEYARLDVLGFTVSHSSQVISGLSALLSRGRRFPQVLQNSKPMKAMVCYSRGSGAT